MANIDALGRDLKKFMGKVEKAVHTAELRTARGPGVKIAQQLSSGFRSSSMLAAMDHPYATRHGEPLLDPEIINKQTERFKDAWKAMDKPSAGGSVPTLYNDDPAAKFLEHGTETMAKRPIEEVIKPMVQPFREKNIKDELSKLTGPEKI